MSSMRLNAFLSKNDVKCAKNEFLRAKNAF